MNELQKIGGNVMACLADKHREKVEALENDTHCKNCGKPEFITWFPKYKSNLTDGLCNKCIDEIY